MDQASALLRWNGAASGLPTFVSGNDALEATIHDIDALGLNPSALNGSYAGWSRLNWQSKATRSGWYRKVNQTGTDAKCEGSTSAGTDCDEFPFHTTLQCGGPKSPLPHLRVISASPNRAQGQRLTTFRSNCAIPEGGAFLVVPRTDTPSITNLCNNGR